MPASHIGEYLSLPSDKSFTTYFLQALEEEFPEPSLLPKDGKDKEEVLEILSDSDAMTSAGFGYLSGSRMGSTSIDGQPQTSDQDKLNLFEQQLEKLENLIQQRGGPFIFG